MPQCGQMKSCAQSRPPFRTPNNPPQPEFPKKVVFASEPKPRRPGENTDAFPGFLRFSKSQLAGSRAPSRHLPTPACSYTYRRHNPSPRVKTRKSKNCETNRTQALGKLRTEKARPNPSGSAFFLSVSIRLTGPLYGGLSGLSVAEIAFSSTACGHSATDPRSRSQSRPIYFLPLIP